MTPIIIPAKRVDVGVFDAVRLDGKLHIPARVYEEREYQCVVCLAKAVGRKKGKRKRFRTVMACDRCNVHLHIGTKDNNCFEIWHTAEDIMADAESDDDENNHDQRTAVDGNTNPKTAASPAPQSLPTRAVRGRSGAPSEPIIANARRPRSNTSNTSPSTATSKRRRRISTTADSSNGNDIAAASTSNYASSLSASSTASTSLPSSSSCTTPSLPESSTPPRDTSDGSSTMGRRRSKTPRFKLAGNGAAREAEEKADERS